MRPWESLSAAGGLARAAPGTEWPALRAAGTRFAEIGAAPRRALVSAGWPMRRGADIRCVKRRAHNFSCCLRRPKAAADGCGAAQCRRPGLGWAQTAVRELADAHAATSGRVKRCRDFISHPRGLAAAPVARPRVVRSAPCGRHDVCRARSGVRRSVLANTGARCSASDVRACEAARATASAGARRDEVARGRLRHMDFGLALR